ncbi:potassium channel family protein [Agromyces endophyticus]|uniref:potassium channel family protein n=1 Tax=Agromyces sp. H17E-10 TaxID=2932244 RepID=UPI001FD528AA|nr:potassium channel family protein [Agromyces sp. H17E-10]UOQ89659.1 potassium channel family protein [Agromyces sp. H17E-10]
MARTRKKVRSELKNTAYEIFIGILSILSILNLVLVYVMRDDRALQVVLSAMNALFSLIFLCDFIYRITTAPSASRYFFRGFGWADLLASLPFAQLKVLRIFRLLRVFRLLRELGPRTIWNTLIHDRANSTLMTLLLLGVLVLQFGSITILAVEEDAEGANITTASDALWYTIVTISTVGYGDQYPVTNLGRLIGAVIIVVGVGIFGTFTGYLANLFLGPQQQAQEAADVAADVATDVAADTGATGAPSTTGAPSATDAPAAAGAPTSGAPTTTVADAAATGVAAGATSGAVTAGATAGSSGTASGHGLPPATASDQSASPALGASPAELSARLAALIAESEATAAELRSLLADASR